MKENFISVKMKMTNGRLVYVDKATQELYRKFLDSVEDGQDVEVLFTAKADKGTNLQLAKIHACIRKLATESGQTFNSMKEDVKRHAGLMWDTPNGIVDKSLGNCSKEELGLVIESIIEIGEFIGINFRGHLSVEAS